MSRSRIVFLLIIGAALLVVVFSQIAPRLPVAPTSTPLPALSLEVAVNPLAYDWVTEQAVAFNNQRHQIQGQPFQIRVTERDGIEIWQGGVWTSTNHPTMWIPEAKFAVDYATETGLRFEAAIPSLATTSLVWGVFADRADVLGSNIDWDTLQQAAAKNSWSALGGQSSWGFVKPAFAYPSRSTPGTAVLLDAAAHFSKNAQLTAQNLNTGDFQNWLRPFIEAVPAFSSLSQRPASVLASRGASTADFALLPESDWLLNYGEINTRQNIRFYYPDFKVVFDMPVAIWNGSDMTSAQRDAVKQFGDFLSQAAAQKRAAAFGLRPALIDLNTADIALFSAAADAGIKLDVPAGTAINVPPRNNVLGLLDWFKSIRSS